MPFVFVVLKVLIPPSVLLNEPITRKLVMTLVHYFRFFRFFTDGLSFVNGLKSKIVRRRFELTEAALVLHFALPHVHQEINLEFR